MSCSPERESLLIAQGWTRQFMAGEPRLGEAVQAYLDLGFAVHLEPVDAQACRTGQCTACFQEPAAAAQLKVIFTRPSASPGDEDMS
jgi:hypothetical protein